MYYSMKTTNKSFTYMWRSLQRNKIQNNLFMLKTNRKELVDFTIEKFQSMDREDPYFSVYKSMIIEEIKENIWFYFRELAVIPDNNSPTGYTHFELTEESMAMIYLYEKQKSFINMSLNNDLCLYFLWNRCVSMYNNDIILVNNFDNMIQISNTIKKYIASMECQVPLGSNQIFGDKINHSVSCDLKSFNSFYIKDRNMTFNDHINYIHRHFIQENAWVNNKPSVFILENDMPLITYSYIINELKKNKFNLYLNGISDINNIDRVILNNFIKPIANIATSLIYDLDDDHLNQIYII